MDSFYLMVKNVLIFIALAIPGYILVKTKQLGSKKTRVLSNILVNIGVPFLIANSTLKIGITVDVVLAMVISAIISVGSVFGMFLISKLLFIKCEETKKIRVAKFAICFSNSGFLGIPIALALFGDVSLVTICVIVMNIFMNIPMFSLGVYIMTGDKKDMSLKKMFLNPTLIAFVIAIIINLTDVMEYVPEVETYTGYLKDIVTPISMIILGMKLGDVSIVSLFKSKLAYVTSVFKLVVYPVLLVGILLLIRLVVNIDNAIIVAAFIAFSMPTASLITSFADKYDSDSSFAVVSTLLSTILCVLTIPLLYYILNLIT